MTGGNFVQHQKHPARSCRSDLRQMAIVPKQRYSFLLVDPELASAEVVELTQKADAAAIGRVLKAVGADLKQKHIDRQALCYDIADAFSTSRLVSDLFEGSKANADL